jgi:hypothetical protein
MSEKILSPSTAKIQYIASASDATIYLTPSKPREDNTKRLRRMRRTTFQSRLGKKMDNITSKVLDNNIRLTAHPTDMIRIAVERDPITRDIISRTVQTAEIMPILLPSMVDIPLHQFKREGSKASDVLVPSLYATMMTQDYFEVYAPVECGLNEDDLLIRMMYDTSPNIEEPYTMVLQVKEVLGTFGYSSLMWKKVIVVFYEETLPDKIIQIIQDNISKREKTGF